MVLFESAASSMRVRMHPQDGRSADGLLYLAAVHDDWHEQERRQRGR